MNISSFLPRMFHDVSIYMLESRKSCCYEDRWVTWKPTTVGERRQAHDEAFSEERSTNDLQVETVRNCHTLPV